MKLLINYWLLIIIYGSSCNYGISQTDSLSQSIVPLNGLIIPPLHVLVDSAINHNAMVGFRIDEIEAKVANLKSKKNIWTRNLGIQGESRYGNFINNAINISNNTSSLLASTTTQLNYSVGVYFKLPLVDVVNRKNEIQIGKVEVRQARNLAEAQKDEVRQLVIKQYEDLILKQKLLNIDSKNLGNAKVSLEMVEKEFKSGVISIYEYVRLSDITARIESDYEIAKSDFLLTKKLMENIVGFSISKYQSK